MPMPGGRTVQYLSEEASVYSNSDVVVIEEDYMSGDDQRDVVYLDDQRNVIYHEEPTPLRICLLAWLPIRLQDVGFCLAAHIELRGVVIER